MSNAKDPWVRVKDEAELKEGMAVQLRNCLFRLSDDALAGDAESTVVVRERATAR